MSNAYPLWFILVLASASLALADAAAPQGPPKAATTRPAEVSKRVKALKAGLPSFQLSLWYVGPQDKPFYTLVLTVPPVAVKKNDPFNLFVHITEAQAASVIDRLADDGFLAHAIDQSHGVNHRAEINGPAYLLSVTEQTDAGRLELFENLGWGLPMLRRIDGLRAAVDGAAGQQIDPLLARLAGLRKQWEQAPKRDADPAR